MHKNKGRLCGVRGAVSLEIQVESVDRGVAALALIHGGFSAYLRVSMMASGYLREADYASGNLAVM
jgi:hypothetical protein